MNAYFRSLKGDFKVQVLESEYGYSLFIDILSGVKVHVNKEDKSIKTKEMLESFRHQFRNLCIDAFLKNWGIDIDNYKLIFEEYEDHYLCYIGYVENQPIEIKDMQGNQLSIMTSEIQ